MLGLLAGARGKAIEPLSPPDNWVSIGTSLPSPRTAIICTLPPMISALGAAHQYPHSDHQYPASERPLKGLMDTGHAGVLQGWYRRIAAQLIAFPSQGGRTPTLRLPSSASPAPKARRWGPPAPASRWLQRVALCCNMSPCVAACRPVLQCVALCCSVSSCVAAWPGRPGTGPSPPFLAPLSVPRALWRRPRGRDHVGQGVKTACRTAAAAMLAIALRHHDAHCAATITYSCTCVHVCVLQRRGNPHVAVGRVAA